MGALDLPYIEREINSTVYRATTLNFEHWADFTEFLTPLVGEPIASVLRGDSVMDNLDMSDMQVILAKLVGELKRDKILRLAKYMALGLRGADSLLTYEKQQLWWPKHMRDLAPVVALFLEAQYLDFFEGVANSLPKTKRGFSDQSQKVDD